MNLPTRLPRINFRTINLARVKSNREKRKDSSKYIITGSVAQSIAGCLFDWIKNPSKLKANGPRYLLSGHFRSKLQRDRWRFYTSNREMQSPLIFFFTVTIDKTITLYNLYIDVSILSLCSFYHALEKRPVIIIIFSSFWTISSEASGFYCHDNHYVLLLFSNHEAI